MQITGNNATETMRHKRTPVHPAQCIGVFVLKIRSYANNVLRLAVSGGDNSTKAEFITNLK